MGEGDPGRTRCYAGGPYNCIFGALFNDAVSCWGYTASVIDDFMSSESKWNDIERFTHNTRRNIGPSATLSNTNLTWTDLRPNSVFYGEKVGTNRLSHDTAPQYYWITKFSERLQRIWTIPYLRTAFFWVITQRVVVTFYRCCGTTYRSHFQGSRIPGFLDSWP